MAKNTLISDILLLSHAFLGTPPCADVIALFLLETVKLTIVSMQIQQEYLHNHPIW